MRTRWIRRLVRAGCWGLAGLLWAAGPGAVRAQQIDNVTRKVSKTGTVAADFLQIPVGARATAMGSAFSASVADATAIYWNPAGLARMEEGRFTAEHATWLGGIDFNFISVTVPTRMGTLGVGVTAMRTDEMDVTTEQQQEGTGETFRASSYAFAVSYGRSLTDRFQLGANVKLITERIWNSSASGVAIDVGTLFTTPFYGIRLGASISNFGTKLKISGDDLLVPVDIAPGQNGNNESTRGLITTDRFDMPLTMRIGLAGDVFQGENSRITLAVDALNPNNNSQYVNLGAEVAFLGELLMIRGGYNELFLADSERSFTLGAGLHYGFGTLALVFDYAYEAHDYFDGVNRFTLSVGF